MEATPFKDGRKLDLVGFDACLMACAENVLLWADYADWMVASEEVESGDGWNWSFLSELGGGAKVRIPEARDLALRIVESFEAYYKSHATDFSNPDATLAAFDLSKVEQLESALSGFAKALLAIAAGDGYGDLNRQRSATRALGLSAVEDKGTGFDLVDLKDLANRLSNVCEAESAAMVDAID